MVIPGRGEIWWADLAKDSVINATQLTAIDKTWLDEFVARLPDHLMQQVDHSLSLNLGLA